MSGNLTGDLPGDPRWRSDFPALQEKIHGQRFAFLDSAASAQKPQVVLDDLRAILGAGYANIHRGLYFNSAQTTSRYEAARVRIAAFFNADPLGLILTRGTTESLNLLAHAWPFQAGAVIALSALEHHANIVPWQLLQARRNIQLRVIPLDDNGAITPENVAAALAPGDVTLLTLTQMSNVTGHCPNLAEIIPLAHAAGVKVLIDGSQGAVHLPTDLTALNPDFYAFTGHKLYGPTSVGGLWVRPALLEEMRPFHGGGDMIESVAFAQTTYAKGVAKFEAGTPPIAEVIALATALDYLDSLGRTAIRTHEHALAQYLDDTLANIEGLSRYGGSAGHGSGIASFNLADCHPSDVAMLLDEQGVAVRSGHHCAMPLHALFGVAGSLRASLALYSSRADIDQLATSLEKARRLLS